MATQRPAFRARNNNNGSRAKNNGNGSSRSNGKGGSRHTVYIQSDTKLPIRKLTQALQAACDRVEREARRGH